MRTWTITLPQTAPFSATVRAFSEAEAVQMAADRLGIYAVPCCETEDAPCAECADDARLSADIRAEDRAIDAARGKP